jgi:putative colanic acid biosynthesis UDP-glucose lipid carrier transferase
LNTAENSISYRDGRYSSLIRPISYVFDLAIIIYSTAFFQEEFDTLIFSIFIGICWIVVSSSTGDFSVHRNAFPHSSKQTFKQLVFFYTRSFAFFWILLSD